MNRAISKLKFYRRNQPKQIILVKIALGLFVRDESCKER